MQIKIDSIVGETELKNFDPAADDQSQPAEKRPVSIAEHIGIPLSPHYIHPLELFLWKDSYEGRYLFIKHIVLREKRHAYQHPSRLKEGHSHVFYTLVEPSGEYCMHAFGTKYKTSREEKRPSCIKPTAPTPEQRLDLEALAGMKGPGRVLHDALWQIVPGSIYREQPDVEPCSHDVGKVCVITREQHRDIRNNQGEWFFYDPSYRIPGMPNPLKEFFKIAATGFNQIVNAPATILDSLVDMDRALGLPSQKKDSAVTFANCANYVASSERAGRVPTNMLEQSPFPNWHATAIQFLAFAHKIIKHAKADYYDKAATAKLAAHAIQRRMLAFPDIYGIADPPSYPLDRSGRHQAVRAGQPVLAAI